MVNVFEFLKLYIFTMFFVFYYFLCDLIARCGGYVSPFLIVKSM